MPEDEFLLLLLIKKNHNKDLLCYLYPVLGISSIDSNLKRDRNGKGGGGGCQTWHVRCYEMHGDLHGYGGRVFVLLSREKNQKICVDTLSFERLKYVCNSWL